MRRLSHFLRKARNRNTETILSTKHIVPPLYSIIIKLTARIKLGSLSEEVVSARSELDETTIRAKSYEKGVRHNLIYTTYVFYNFWILLSLWKSYSDMQDSYALMAKTMKDQYELQKQEPGLRCELNQVRLWVSPECTTYQHWCAISTTKTSAAGSFIQKDSRS